MEKEYYGQYQWILRIEIIVSFSAKFNRRMARSVLVPMLCIWWKRNGDLIRKIYDKPDYRMWRLIRVGNTLRRISLKDQSR